MNIRTVIAVTLLVVIGGIVLHSNNDVSIHTKQFFAIALTAVAGGLVLAGHFVDQETASNALPESEQLSVGCEVPDFPVKIVNSEQSTFNQMRKKTAIVAFVSPDGAQCCWLNPALVSLAEELHDEDTAVIQISEPTDRCSHDTEGVVAYEFTNLHMFSLCDVGRLAWHAYGKPRPGTVALIDCRGEVILIAALDELVEIVTETRRLIAELGDVSMRAGSVSSHNGHVEGTYGKAASA